MPVQTSHKLTKRQRHHQMNIEKQRLVRRLSKQHQQASSSDVYTTTTTTTSNAIPDITPDMVEEASKRCSVDRFRSLLPPKIKTKPTYPPRFAKISVRALPYAARKFSLPWMHSIENAAADMNREVIDLTASPSSSPSSTSCLDRSLTGELLRFTEFVTVRKWVVKWLWWSAVAQ